MSCEKDRRVRIKRMDRPVFGVKSENRAVFYVRFADGACADKKENIKK